MKRIPMLLLLAAPYIFIAACAAKGTIAFLTWILLCVLIYLPNMIYAFILPRMGYGGRQLLFWSLLLKVMNIPVFAMIIFFVLLFNIFVLPMAPFLILFDYTLLLPSSMYGVSGLIACCREGKLSKKALVINIIMQFTFCLDVFSAVYGYVKARKKQSVL